MRQGTALLAIALLTAGLTASVTGQAQAPVPDLAVVEVGWDQIEDGEETTFRTVIENQGDGDRTTEFTVDLFLEDAGFSYTETVDGLEAGDSLEITAEDTWTASIGSYTFNTTIGTGLTDAEESNNFRNRSFTIGPDLTVQKVRVQPSTPVEGDDVEFAATIENVAEDTDFDDSFDVEFRVEDAQGDTETLTESVDGLRAKATKRVLSDTWTADDPGDYNVTAVVNPGADGEADPTNNSATRAFGVSEAQPDLVVESVEPSPRNPQAGATATVEARIVNQGNEDVTTPFSVRFRINGSTFGPDVSAPIGDGLEPGDNVTVESQNWTTQAGHNELTAIADPDDNVTGEASTINNEETTELHVGPDLVVADILWTPDTPAAQNDVEFDVRVLNQGTAPVEVNTTVRLFVEQADVDRTAEIGPVDPGDSDQVSLGSWEPQDDRDYTVHAIADVEEEADEVDDANNEREETMTVSEPLPDLVTTEIETTPPDPGAGDDTTVEATIQNQGSAAADQVDVTFFADGDQIGETKTERDGFGEELAAGDSVTVESDTWTPNVGNHSIKVHPASPGEEITETNNNLTVEQLVGPDASVEDVEWAPTNPDVGDRVTFDVTVANPGTESIEDLPIHVSVDGETVGNATIGTLDPGGEKTVSVDWTATEGDHTVLATADPDDNVTEARETNNEREESFSTTSSADLQATSIRWATDPQAGDTLVFTAQVANTGTGEVAGSFEVRFRIGGEQLGTATIDGLESGQSVSVSSDDWTAQAGSHPIRAIVDASDVVNEDDETNNDRTETVVVAAEPDDDEDQDPTGPPNLVVTGITPPDDPQPGDEVTFLASIENQGGEDATDTSVRFLIDDEALGQRTVDALAPGQSSSVTSAAWNATEGEHTLTVIADVGSDVDESDEEDNERLKKFQVGAVDETPDPEAPNLRLSASYAGNIEVGQALELTANVTNAGDASARNVTVEFFVDGTRLGTATVDEIAPDETRTVEGPTWDAIEGEHTIVTRAGDVQTEHDVVVSASEEDGVPAPGLAVLVATLASAALGARRRER